MKKVISGLAILFVFAFAGFLFVGCGNENSGDLSDNCEHAHKKEIVMEATCIKSGRKTVVCTDCGYVFSPETLPALGHDVGEDGEIYEATCTSPKTTVKQCTRCDEYVEFTEGEPLGHDFVIYALNPETPATCTTAEKENYVCTRCGTKKSVIKDGEEPAKGHNYVHDETHDTDASCITSGGTYYECTECGDYYVDVIPATGHTSDGTENITEPTCIEKGYTTLHCSVCNEDYKVNFVEPLGHLIENEDSITATCSHMGYDIQRCTRCDYEERSNAKANLAHTFDEDGVCSVCGESALNAFALMCGEKEIYPIMKNGTTYTIYSPSYEWAKMEIPAEVLQALYAQGVYSFNIWLGSNADSVAKTVSLTMQGQNKAVNVSPNEIKLTHEYAFADANGVFAKDKGGIKLEGYYRAMDKTDSIVGGSLVSCYCIKFEFIRQFNIDDANTWLKTALPYTYDENSDVFTFTEVNTAGRNDFSVNRELLEHYLNLGYKTLEITLTSASGQSFSKNITAFSDGTKVITSGNTNDKNAVIRVNLQDVAEYNLDLQCGCIDHYGNPTFNPQSPMDKMIISLAFVKDVRAYYVDSSSATVEIEYRSETEYNFQGETITYTFENVMNRVYAYYYFNSTFVNEKIEEGYTQMTFTVQTGGYKNGGLYIINDGTFTTLSAIGPTNAQFASGAVDLTEDAVYLIKFLHNVNDTEEGLESPANIIIKVQFTKSVKAITTVNGADYENDISYTSEVSTTTAENDTITYTFSAVPTGSTNHFCFNVPLINEKIAAGFTKVTFSFNAANGVVNRAIITYSSASTPSGTYDVANGSSTFTFTTRDLEGVYFYRIQLNMWDTSSANRDIVITAVFS